jgi:DNA mismatch repair protein MutS2
MTIHTYNVIGFFNLLDILSRYASCHLGRSNCLSLKPLKALTQIDRELGLVSEMRLLSKVKGVMSFSGLASVKPFLQKAETKGSFLEPEELLNILKLGKAGWQAKKFFLPEKDICPLLSEMARDIPEVEYLVNVLSKAISQNGAIKDSASPELKKIRHKKTRLRFDLKQKLEVVQKAAGIYDAEHDNVITVRDGRYILSVKTDQKRRLKGILHDYSRTRTSCYLEPAQVVHDNNRMAELAREEKQEEFRILASLTAMVKKQSEKLEGLEFIIGRLDGLYARARFGEALSCVMPEIAEHNAVNLSGVVNPLLFAFNLEKHSLRKQEAPPVPADILIDVERNVLIISGPNGGGKTVALKTLGLVVLMAHAGMHIPAKEGSSLPFFSNIMADIGDDQDIQTGLSTFSAHMAHFKHILDYADEKSLVIIDEPGMGTDPAEGVALTMALIDDLSSRGTLVAVSTHLNRLKSYGFMNPRAVNASVEFDAEQNCPTFRLNYGSSGISHALDVAREMGVSQKIIDHAEAYLSREEIALSVQIEKFNSMLLESEREKEAAEAVKKKHNAAVKRIEADLLRLEQEKKTLLNAKRLEAEAVIKDAKEDLKRVINRLKKKQTAQDAVADMVAEVSHKLADSFDKKEEVPLQITDDLREGQLVYHKKLKQKGRVLSVNQAGRQATILVGKIRLSAESQDLSVIAPGDESRSNKKKKNIFWQKTSCFPVELNVIGHRVDSAVGLIDKAIDRALVSGVLNLKIVHGFGTGILRQAIRDHLRKNPFVKNVCRADFKSGGEAITIVEL